MAMMEADKLKEYAVFANKLADQGRSVTLNYFRQSPEAETKEDGSPVTIADRECELLIRKQIGDTYPEHCIRGEEFQTTGAGENDTWVINPIDGTK